MPRNMSFSITTEQMRNRTKTVTRRLGWKFLKPGDVVNAVEKAMGLKPGEKIQRICQIRILSNKPEALRLMLVREDYGRRETTLEGYPAGTEKHDPDLFIEMFCKAMKCKPSTMVNRIEFEYIA
jgi:hypothetical protein